MEVYLKYALKEVYLKYTLMEVYLKYTLSILHTYMYK